MKFFTTIGMLMVSALATGTACCGQEPPENRYEEEGYTLVWADEFNEDGRPDPANWTYEHGFSRNREEQWYQPDNAFCENGLLVIEGRRERVKNPGHDPDSNHWKTQRRSARYTSSSLITQGLHSWQYGRFEMRARFEAKDGLWPAFWSLGIDGGWPQNGEIDIMEYYRGKILANFFWGSEQRWTPKKKVAHRSLDSFADRDWAENFHIWRMDWNEERIQLFVDDELLNEINVADTFNPPGNPVENPFRQPHYLLVNLAIGGNSGGDPSRTPFPVRYEIDYVRVYQKQSRE